MVADNGEIDLEVGDEGEEPFFDLSLFFFFFLRIGDAGEFMVFIAGRGGRLLLLSSILSFLCFCVNGRVFFPGSHSIINSTWDLCLRVEATRSNRTKQDLTKP